MPDAEQIPKELAYPAKVNWWKN